MAEFIPIILQFSIFGGLILLGLFAGGQAERAHLKSLEAREAQLAGMLLTDLKSFPGGAAPTPTPELIVGEVSIASDYLKSLLAGLRNLIGGEIRSFETLQQGHFYVTPADESQTEEQQERQLRGHSLHTIPIVALMKRA